MFSGTSKGGREQIERPDFTGDFDNGRSRGNELSNNKIVSASFFESMSDPFAAEPESNTNDIPFATDQEQVQQRLDQAGAFGAIGRVSLAVDFPLGENPVHFQKLKGDARLALVAHAEHDGRPAWQWLALAGGFVVVLGGFMVRK